MKHLHFVCLGHFDHGKSTLLGRLFYDTKNISREEMNRIKKIARELNKPGFEFAFIMDQIKEERMRGITIGLARKKLLTKSISFTFADAPGHKDFIKSMLTGASESDAAILVVAAEKGIQKQTKEHLYLSKMLALPKMVVVINKMDLVDFKRDKFNQLKRKIRILLRKTGYSLKEIPIVPCSALLGENVVKKSKKMKWYKGPTLFEILKNLPEREIPGNLPLRMPVQDIYSVKEGWAVIGKIETGSLKAGEKVLVMPQNKEWEVEKIFIHDKEVKKADPDDNIYLFLKGLKKNDIKRGNIIGRKKEKPSITDKFIAQVVILNCLNDLKRNNKLDFEMITEATSCKISKLLKKIDTATGQVIQNNPQKIKNGESAVIEIKTEKPIYIETQKDIPQLANFRLLERGKQIAIGICLKI
jgi:elongation factor 1-alpha